MPTYDDHCRKCEQELGDAFEHVHLWLDEFYGKSPCYSRHRFLRHHLKGIEEVREMWGDRAAMAAEIHIRQDLESDGWESGKPLPKNGEAYKKEGLW